MQLFWIQFAIRIAVQVLATLAQGDPKLREQLKPYFQEAYTSIATVYPEFVVEHVMASVPKDLGELKLSDIS